MNFPVRSLFLKIFIWFWLAMILVNVALFAAVAVLAFGTLLGQSNLVTVGAALAAA